MQTGDDQNTDKHSVVSRQTDTEKGPLLKSLKEQSINELRHLCNDLLLACEGHLFDLTVQTKPGDWRNTLYDATNVIRRERNVLLDIFTNTLNSYFKDPFDKETTTEEEVDDKLDLIDKNIYEDWLLVEGIIKKSLEKNEDVLECLTTRYAYLLNADDSKHIRLPIHVKKICKALQEAIAPHTILNLVSSEIFTLFSQHFVNELDAIYHNANSLLRKEGILPGLEEELEQHQAEKIKAAIREKKSLHDSVNSRSSSYVQQGGKISASSQPFLLSPQIDIIKQLINAPALYQSIIEALSIDHITSQFSDSSYQFYSDTENIPEDKRVIVGEGTLIDVLSELQKDNKTSSYLLHTHSLKRYLQDNQQDIVQLRDAHGITPQASSRLKLVDQLFTNIHTKLDIPESLRESLSSLHIPLAKIAIQDSEFFQKKTHPIRKIIESLINLANAANYPNKALEKRFHDITHTIADNHYNDAAIFNRAQADTEKLIEQQTNALLRNTDRVVKTQDGQQRLDQAKKSVERTLLARIRPPSAPQPLVDLVKAGWRDLLVLNYVKNGPDSEPYKEALKTFDTLTLWLLEHSKNSEASKLEKVLEADTFIDMVKQQLISAMPINTDYEPVIENLRKVLNHQAPLKFVDIEQTPSSTQSSIFEHKAKLTSLPRLRRWLKRAQHVETGTWLDYKNNEDQTKRMQLAWASDDKERYAFVDERGRLIEAMNIIALARKLSKGYQPSLSNRLSPIDQAMYDTLENIQKTLVLKSCYHPRTKLINKKTFLKQLNNTARNARICHKEHCLLYLDTHNETPLGDHSTENEEALQAFAELLDSYGNHSKSFAYLGENSFSCILPNYSPNQAILYAEKLLTHINRSNLLLDGEPVNIKGSIGITAVRHNSPDTNTLLDNAQQACHLAKQQSHNHIAIYEAPIHTVEPFSLQSEDWGIQLREQLMKESLVLQAQPIQRTTITSKGEKTFYEIFLGVRDHQGNIHSPAEVIETSEKYGHMSDIDRWVVTEAFSWLNALVAQERDIPHLSINLSGASLGDDGFMDFLFKSAGKLHAAPDKICFEITEAGILTNIIKASDFVRAFKELGFQFALDDFGTTPGSHSYLRKLPVDYIKIDGSFITDIEHNSTSFAIVKSINNMAHFLGQKTVAEFVETVSVAEKLKMIGVDYIQGWGVGRPHSLEDIRL